ncbi:anti-sigma-K factor RskA [Curtobacterium luteum]|uniref:Regulator of SigK n=1 Tax=Curtobacterium luteum TaxID=33881 RepID=A0A8H9G8P7_9MICO|nr:MULTISPECIES: anti-sigma factor [Curtobacterium]MBM7802927.1 anti-sigma-K factor RskA [Curtobacterium luteum]NUU49772.1 anti-sigma factor [Curtobacterium luteum]GGL01219.1 hypothetical protein GCM10009769_19270 [Curtobacterium luteum]
MTDRHDDPSSLTGSYALDALSDEERTQVEDALAFSSDLRAEADSLRETALQLAYSTDPIEPPASLKASLMAQIQTTPQVAAPAASFADTPALDDGLEARSASAPSPTSSVVPGPAESAARRRWFQRPAAAMSAAAAVAVVFLGVGLSVGGVLNPGSEPGPGAGSSQSSSVLDGIYAASDFQRSSTPVEGGGTATVVWSKDIGKSAVILDGVQAAPKGKTYELWYIASKASGGAIKPAGLMEQSSDGVHSAVLTGDLQDGVTVGITVEPAGGSEQPTTTPIAAVPLDA